MTLNFLESIQKEADKFKDWIINHNGPGLMIIIILLGLAVFSFTYNSLHKND